MRNRFFVRWVIILLDYFVGLWELSELMEGKVIWKLKYVINVMLYIVDLIDKKNEV